MRLIISAAIFTIVQSISASAQPLCKEICVKPKICIFSDFFNLPPRCDIPNLDKNIILDDFGGSFSYFADDGNRVTVSKPEFKLKGHGG